MKTLSNNLKFSKCKHIFLIVFFSAIGLLNTFVSAQNMIAKLTDAEIRTVIPILKAEIAGYTKLENAMATEQDLQHQLFLDIKSGKTDPLDWLKQHSKHIIVPPGAIYESACSRAVSIKGIWDLDPEAETKSSALPTAIFTFGKDFPAINKNLLGNNITQESYSRFLENPYNVNDPSYEKIKSILDEALSFYTKNGFSASYGMSYGTAVSFNHIDDEGYISGVVYNLDLSLFDPTFSNTIKQCRSHPMGPSIVIQAESKLIDKIFASKESSNAVDENTSGNLKKAGITPDRYALIKSTLLTARNDSENPDGVEIPAFDFTPTTPEEKEMARAFASMKEDALARKDNILLYKKYKTELDPILDILQKYMGGQ
jgi:hypothetical protein